MIWAKQWNGNPASGGTLMMELDYKYDYFGNLIEKDEHVWAYGVDDGGTTYLYFYDGWDPAKANAAGTSGWDVWSDVDGDSNLVSLYLLGDGVNQIFGRIDDWGQISWQNDDGQPHEDQSEFTPTGAWLVQDRQGSVVGVVDTGGNLQDQISYDAYGNILSETDADWGGRFKYAGMMYDQDLSLYLDRARVYDPTTGRYMSQDPLGFDAGDSNLYRYVFNSPTKGTDPSGQFAPASSGNIRPISGGWPMGMGNIGSHGPVNPTTALSGAQRWLGPGYREIAPGVYRSADGLRQFRMTTSDLLPTHGNIGPHVHFDALDAAGDVIENLHLPITP
jgi:RHS repeat-associated protein